MKLLSAMGLTLFLALIYCAGAWAQQLPVIGSCTHSALGKNWAQCDFTSVADPKSKTHGDIQSCALSCYDYVGYQSNENCQYPPKIAECTLTNPSYAGQCVENVEYFGEKTPENACGEIRDYLNNVTNAGQNGCLKTYCSNTAIRLNWTLTSAH